MALPASLPDILAQIAQVKVEEVQQARARVPLAEMRRRAEAAPRPRDWRAALTKPGVQVIAEVKAASPSAGVIHAQLNPGAQAQRYARAGAAAISVLTDPTFFHGDLAHLQAVRAAVSLPVLRKDFLLDPYQVYEARAAGADAVLLIVALLDDARLRDLLALSRELGLGTLVEVHTEAELERALAAGADVLGVNNRNLHTFEVDLRVSETLLPRVPAGVVRVAESGVATPEDVRRMACAGADAVLVGTALMRAADPEAATRALVRAGHVGCSPETLPGGEG
ncbi:MAG: indole-3-glycerol phosphate synthase TrpC [Chloroflexi bacterium]|nr:indole-3-glycerol phosphate synthase TrpC [Chloroflexota bacterium]